VVLKVRGTTFASSRGLDLSLGDNADGVVVGARGKNLFSIFEIFIQGVVILFVVIIITFI
jgi:hypothetical protein